MHVLVLGATGSIGRAVADELTVAGHRVVGLARSDRADADLAGRGIEPLRGDLRGPHNWCAAVRSVDAVVQAAATFDADEGAVERAVLEALIAALAGSARRPRFLYTGGCWLYGATGDAVADETAPVDPLPAFAWMIEHARMLVEAPGFETMVVHPAMVYTRDGGVLSGFLEAAQAGRPIEVWGSLDTRWPVVEARDLAVAYRLILERGRPGEAYNVAAEAGVRVGDIVAALARRFGIASAPIVRPIEEAVAELGDWAEGLALDQQMASDKIRNELGWTPARDSILRETA